MKELNKDFFKRDTLDVAKDLVGKILCVDNTCARITEVEAYKQDKASHARKRTKRSELMFTSFGKVYVYLIYGMYYCLNFTSDVSAGAVLIRGLDLKGCDGPGKLCKVLGISKADNGLDIGSRFKVFDDGYVPKLRKSQRIGIKDDVHLKWRFFDNK